MTKVMWARPGRKAAIVERRGKARRAGKQMELLNTPARREEYR